MKLQVRLVNIWKFISISALISLGLIFFFVSILIYHEVLIIILGIAAFFLSLIIGSVLGTTTKNVEVRNGLLFINESRIFKLESIEWYNEDSNFLLSGISIKADRKRNYNYMSPKLIHRDPNFEIFKDILVNKKDGDEIIEKQTHEILSQNKFLRYAAYFLLILFPIIIVANLIWDLEIEKLKLISFGAITLGTFLSTRKY